MTFASDLQQRQQLQKQYCPIKSNIKWRFLGRGLEISDHFFVAHTSCKERNNIWAGGRRIMFIQYGNQNGFCVRPEREGGKF